MRELQTVPWILLNLSCQSVGTSMTYRYISVTMCGSRSTEACVDFRSRTASSLSSYIEKHGVLRHDRAYNPHVTCSRHMFCRFQICSHYHHNSCDALQHLQCSFLPNRYDIGLGLGLVASTIFSQYRHIADKSLCNCVPVPSIWKLASFYCQNGVSSSLGPSYTSS